MQIYIWQHSRFYKVLIIVMLSADKQVLEWLLKLEVVDAVDNLKKKVIEAYNMYLNRMYLGYKSSYEHIL